MASDGKKVKPKGKSNEEIFAGFQLLRSEQRNLANKLTELEPDLHEHKLVIETLKGVDGNRKCFRMVGGVLCEKTVKDVLPVLETNSEQLNQIIEALTESLTKKGVEVNEYKEKHNIIIRGQDDPMPSELDSETNDQSNRVGSLVVPT